MKRALLVPVLVCLLSLFFSVAALADPPDTIVFRSAMLPGNETPPITGTTASGNVVVTIFVNRDNDGLITSGTVDFNVNFTGFPAETRFTGLHIHNGLAGISGPVVIPTNLGSGANSVITSTGSGNIFRRAVVDGTNTNLLRFLRGVVSQPQLYYVNLHTTVFPGGAIRSAQLAPSRLVFRTKMTPDQETPPIANLAAVGVATITINLSRDATGAVVSGTVDFDVAFQFPSGPITITGLHIHNGPAGVAAPVVIPTGIGSGNNAVVIDSGGGNIFRRVDIPGTNAAGLAALNGIVADPTQFYVNLHTSTNPDGAIRGQFSTDTYSFLKTMLPLFEVPPLTALANSARALLTAKVTRDATGNITSGSMEFNVDFLMTGPVTFNGLHIHNGTEGTNASVVISSGLNSLTSDSGAGNITRTATISADNATAVTALKGLIDAPEKYYVNLHTTDSPNGFVRSQLERNILAFRVRMRPENEVPPNTINASASGWVVARFVRDANGKTIWATVDFDISTQFPGATTFNGLHIHESPQGTNGPVVINSGLSSVTDDDGIGVIFSRGALSGLDPGLAALDRLAQNPAGFYVNLHTTQFPDGAVRHQLAGNTLFFPQVGGGGGQSTTINITNPSNTDSAGGIVFFTAPGGGVFSLVGNSVVPFVIPPGGTISLAINSQGARSPGSARIVSADTLSVTETFLFPGATPITVNASAPSEFGFSAPVFRDLPKGIEAGVAVLNASNASVFVVYSLFDSGGLQLRSFKATAILAPGEQLSRCIGELFPGLPAAFQGSLRIRPLSPLPTQSIVVTVVEFGPGLFFNVTLSPLAKPTQWEMEEIDR